MKVLNHVPSFTGRYFEFYNGGSFLYFALEPTKAVLNIEDINRIRFYTELFVHRDIINLGILKGRVKDEVIDNNTWIMDPIESSVAYYLNNCKEHMVAPELISDSQLSLLKRTKFVQYSLNSLTRLLEPEDFVFIDLSNKLFDEDEFKLILRKLKTMKNPALLLIRKNDLVLDSKMNIIELDDDHILIKNRRVH